MKLDKHCITIEMFVQHDIPGFGELPRKHITNVIHRRQSSSNSIIMSVASSSVRCLLLSGATDLILYTLANDILSSVYTLFLLCLCPTDNLFFY